MEIPTTEPPRIKGHYCQVSPEAMEKFLEGSVVGIFSCRWVDSLCGWATPRRTSATPRDVPCLRPWAYPDYTPGGTHPGKAIPRTERETLYVAICVCNVLGFRFWSRAGMLVSPEYIFRPKGSHFTLLFAGALFWVFGIARMLVSPKRVLRSKITGL